MSADEGVAELVTFACSKEAYVYAPLPPATSYGHRAELWNPDKWLKEVRVKVVTAGDLCYVRMLDRDTGELFAECPLPHDGTALTTAVEPVVDSSRYFVARVVDRESRKHAFIGIGFRERNDASDFAAALDDYRQYLRRKQEAEQMREEFSRLETAYGNASDAAATAGGLDLSLKPGQTIRINLSSSTKRTASGKSSSTTATTTSSSSSEGGGGSGTASPQLKLAPPPAAAAAGGSSSAFFKLQPPPPSGSPAAAAAAVAAAAAAAAAAGGASHRSGGPGGDSSSSSEQQMGPASNPSSPQASTAGAAASRAAAAAAAAAAGDGDGDDWGDFCDAATH